MSGLKGEAGQDVSPIEDVMVACRREGIAGEERGQELLEAAVTIPILLALLLGMLSFARGYNAYQTMRGAGRSPLVLTSCATCGNAAVQSASVRTIVDGVLTSANFDPSKMTNYAARFVWVDGSSATQQCALQGESNN